MGIRSAAGRILAAMTVWNSNAWSKRAFEGQLNVLDQIVSRAAHTKFGIDHNFRKIKGYADFKKAVPIRDYEQAKPYFDAIAAGEKDVTWPGKPKYLAKTSGTTSGTKYIPITSQSLPNHLEGARSALLHYIHYSKNAKFLDGKLMFLSGSPELETKNGILTGRLSGIVNHHIPNYLKASQLPSFETNSIDDWEAKVDAIVAETKHADMRLISGIPPWLIMYFERLQAVSGNKPAALFPNFSLIVQGGVNFEPYRQPLLSALGRDVDFVELYPASEGFFAHQTTRDDAGLLLLTEMGIFYEFVPVETLSSETPTRLHIGEVELGVNYAMVISSNAGLWGYLIGDTVKFIGLNPYKIRVTGRIKHFLSAFGEHVIGEEVAKAIQTAAKETGAEMMDYTVAPQVAPNEGLPYHEWFVAFKQAPTNLATFAEVLDASLQLQNSYYADLRVGNILREAVVHSLPADALSEYMRSVGKLGGQNKLPNLLNDRTIADQLLRTNAH